MCIITSNNIFFSLPDVYLHNISSAAVADGRRLGTVHAANATDAATTVPLLQPSGTTNDGAATSDVKQLTRHAARHATANATELATFTRNATSDAPTDKYATDATPT